MGQKSVEHTVLIGASAMSHDTISSKMSVRFQRWSDKKIRFANTLSFNAIKHIITYYEFLIKATNQPTKSHDQSSHIMSPKIAYGSLWFSLDPFKDIRRDGVYLVFFWQIPDGWHLAWKMAFTLLFLLFDFSTDSDVNWLELRLFAIE